MLVLHIASASQPRMMNRHRYSHHNTANITAEANCCSRRATSNCCYSHTS
jgi:hypothetical protein